VGDVIRTTARKDGGRGWEVGGSDTCMKFVCGDNSTGPSDVKSLPDTAQTADILCSNLID